MDLTSLLLAAFDREVDRSRRVLEHIPDGDHYDWKPHERSMPFGYLADLVATIPTWIALQLTGDELDIMPEGGSSVRREPHRTRESLLTALADSSAKARAALLQASPDHLDAEWRLKAKGIVVQSHERSLMIEDTLLHWAHHRGQLTVYLRLLGSTVPALYGPSADDQSFGPS